MFSGGLLLWKRDRECFFCDISEFRIKNKRYKLTSIIDAFPLIQRIVVNDDMAFKIKNGCVMEKFFDNDLAFILDKNNKLLALYKNIDNNSKAYRVFQ